MAIKLSDYQNVCDFLHNTHIIHIATLMKDGSPQSSGVAFERIGDLLMCNFAEGTLKARNVARDPRVAFSIDVPDPASGYTSFMLLRGKVVRLAAGEEGLEGAKILGAKFARIKGINLEDMKLDDDNKMTENQEGRVSAFIEIHHIHHFLMHHGAVLTSITENGVKEANLTDPERHKMWQNKG